MLWHKIQGANEPRAWNISGAEFSSSFSVASQASLPADISFKADGLKMYVLCATNNEVYEYSLSTAWDISTASYSKLFDFSAQDIAPNGLFIKPDGTKMYMTGETGDDINEYNLSTAWDVSTASYVQNLSVVGRTGISFKTDGTKMYVTDTSDNVHEYSLSSAWDISTASFVQTFSVGANITTIRGIFFRSDGERLFLCGRSTPEEGVYQCQLTTPWDISTATFVKSFNIQSEQTQPGGIFFKPDGLKMFIGGFSPDSVTAYDL